MVLLRWLGTLYTRLITGSRRPISRVQIVRWSRPSPDAPWHQRDRPAPAGIPLDDGDADRF